MARAATVSAEQFAAAISEKAFQAQVVQAAHLYGWLTIHIPNARFNPIMPDLLLLKDSRVVWVELKTERGRLGKKQLERLQELASAGMDVRVWRPSMWSWIEETLRGER